MIKAASLPHFIILFSWRSRRFQSIIPVAPLVDQFTLHRFIFLIAFCNLQTQRTSQPAVVYTCAHIRIAGTPVLVRSSARQPLGIRRQDHNVLFSSQDKFFRKARTTQLGQRTSSLFQAVQAIANRNRKSQCAPRRTSAGTCRRHMDNPVGKV